MAVTILQQPQLITPVYNPIILALNSDKKTETNFQYLLELVIDGSTITPLLEIPSNPDGYGVADIHKHLESYVTTNLETANLSIFRKMEDSYIEYGVNIYEEYDVSGTTTVFSASTYSATTYTFNGVETTLDFIDWDYNDYVMETSTPGKFLTTIPTEGITVKEDDMLFVNYYNQTTNTTNYLEVTTSNGGVYQFTNVYQPTSTSTKFLTVAVGPYHLKNSTTSYTATTGTYPVIQDTTDWYTFKLLDFSGGTTSETKKVYINRVCSKFENYNLLYLDARGSYLNFNFDLASKKTRSVERKSYYQNVGSFNPNTLQWDYNTYDRGTRVINTVSKDKYNLTSNWVTEWDGNRIEDLISSPDVYRLLPGTITYNTQSTDGILSYSDNGGLLQLAVTAHGLSVGDIVLIYSTIPAYNNIYVYITSIDTVDAFTVNFPYNGNSLTGTDKIDYVTVTATPGSLIGVNVDTNSIEVKQKNTTKNINYTLDITYSFLNNSQK